MISLIKLHIQCYIGADKKSKGGNKTKGGNEDQHQPEVL